MTRRRSNAVTLASALVFCALGVATAALPPGYGGDLRLPASAPLGLPTPTTARTPLESSIANAVFDSPASLGTIAQDDDSVVLTLRAGVRTHQRRELRAADVASSLRRLDRSSDGWWLAPLARSGNAVDISTEDAHSLRIRGQADVDVAALLALPALGVAPRPSRGTGPFRPRRVGDQLRLLQFRSAARGAPYLRSVVFSPPRPRDAELRSLVLGELDGSWVGSSVYGGEPARPVRTAASTSPVPVLLIPSAARRPYRSWLSAVIDRGRLARLGITPGDRLHAELPRSNAPAHPDDAPPSSWTLIVRAGDTFATEVARALSAMLDERNVRLIVREIPDARWANALAGSWDLHIAQVVPRHPPEAPWLASGVILASAYAECHDTPLAARMLTATFKRELESGFAAILPAVVLGHRTPTLHLDATFDGADADALGRFPFDSIHRARSATP